VSGIAGIFNVDGDAIDSSLLQRMAESMHYWGGDSRATRNFGAAGFGHALLRTTDESEHECQPLTLDGQVWVVADARIDGRDALVQELSACTQVAIHHPQDVELIAHAYSVWGEGCVKHLVGDFAFAIWDSSKKLVFCARDHMGVKPFYYAHRGSSLVFSNSLEAIRLHPSVSTRLNDCAIADFLLFGLNHDQAKTTFADIDRLPPGHTLTYSVCGMSLNRYWTLPIDDPVFYRRDDDYVEQFQQLLHFAVKDRLRIPRVSILMSGGLDSTALAATAGRLLKTRRDHPGLKALTITFQDDAESSYAKLAAEHLGIPLELRCWDPNQFNSEWYKTSFHTPEPVPYPTDLPGDWANYRQLALHSRVAFEGEGPDNALRCEWRPYFSYLLRKGLFVRLAKDIYFQTALHGRLPLPKISGIRTQLSGQKEMVGFPTWLQPSFERRHELRSRWEQKNSVQSCLHNVRPLAYSSLIHPLWQSMFERYQPEYTRSPFEVRHPFLDVRLLRFLLAVPVLPWCRHKYLLRRAMRGSLPEAILARPKSPLINDQWAEHVRGLGLPAVPFTEALENYVDTHMLIQPSDPASFWVDFRVRSLAYWLRNMNCRLTTP